MVALLRRIGFAIVAYTGLACVALCVLVLLPVRIVLGAVLGIVAGVDEWKRAAVKAVKNYATAVHAKRPAGKPAAAASAPPPNADGYQSVDRRRFGRLSWPH